MINWLSFVFLRLVISLILGIVFALYFPKIEVLEWAFFIFSGLYIVLFFTFKNTQILGGVALSSIFCFGASLVYQNNETDDPLHFQHQQNFDYYQAVLISDIKESKIFYSATAKIYAVMKNNTWKNTNGKINIDFNKNEVSANLKYGNHLIIRGLPEKIKNLQNPAEFDKKAYFAAQNIYHQHIIYGNSYRLLRDEPESKIIDISLKIRHLVDNQMKSFFPSQEAYSIATALLLGIKDHLERDIKTAYSESGTMHVLAVSGLHVGIIYTIFAFLFGKIKKLRFGKIFYPISIIILILFYAFLTGLSPSVMRATIMFGLLVVAESLGRTRNSLNVLAFSAFVLLCYEPFLIQNLGFQFSYLAVFSILLFEKKIRTFYQPKNKFISFFWNIASVSIAAQILVTPISLYYFHQFPLHFILSNALVVPAAGVILWGILLGLLAGNIHNFLGVGIFWIVDKLIIFQNICIDLLNHIPYVLLKNIYPNLLEIISLYLIIIFIALFFYTKRILYFYLTFSISFIIFISQIQEYLKHEKQHELYIWNIPNRTALSIHRKYSGVLLADSTLILNESNQDFHFKNFWGENNINYKRNWIIGNPIEDLAHKNFEKYDYWIYEQKSFLLLHKKFYRGFLPSANYLIITNNALTDWNKIDVLGYDYFVFDASNSQKYVQKMLSKADSLDINCYNVKTDGAFKIDFNIP